MLARRACVNANIILGILLMAAVAKGQGVTYPTREQMIRLLPMTAQLPGYTIQRMQTFNPPYHGVSFYAIRKQDGASLDVSYTLLDTDEKALKYARLFNAQSQIAPLEGGMTGRRIGEHSWHPQHPRSTHPVGGYTITVQDGRAFVRVDLGLRLAGYEDGHPVEALTPYADVKFVEDQAIACLERLKKAGYTSGRPVVQTITPANTSSRRTR